MVVVLTGRRKRWPTHGEYRTSPLTEPFSGVHFRIEPVYQRTVAELVAWGPFWMIFAPLAIDADEQKLAEVVELLRTQTTPHGFRELAALMKEPVSETLLLRIRQGLHASKFTPRGIKAKVPRQ